MSANISFDRIREIKASGREAGINAAFDGSRGAAANFSNNRESGAGHEKVSSMFAAATTATFFNGDFRGETARQNLNDFANQGGERISFN